MLTCKYAYACACILNGKYIYVHDPERGGGRANGKIGEGLGPHWYRELRILKPRRIRSHIRNGFVLRIKEQPRAGSFTEKTTNKKSCDIVPVRVRCNFSDFFL